MLLVVGAQCTLALIPRRQPGRAFFVTCAFFYGVLASLIVLWSATPRTGLDSIQNVAFLVFAVSVAAYNLALWTGREGLERGLLGAGALAGSVAVIACALGHARRVIYPVSDHPVTLILVVLAFAVTAVGRGAVTTGMILGHWYLIRPKGLTIEPLFRVSRLLMAASCLELAVTVTSLAWFQAVGSPGQIGLLYQGYSMYFWIRILVGNLFSLVLAYMILETAKLEANMSATGLLYIAMMTMMAGSMMATFILVNAGILV